MKEMTRRWGLDRDAQLAALASFDPMKERRMAALNGDLMADRIRIDRAMASCDPSLLKWADMAVLTSVPSPMRRIPQIIRHLAATGQYRATR